MGILRRFLSDYARRYLRWYALGLVCLLLTNLLTVSIPGFVQRAVDALDGGRGPDGAAPWAWAVLAAGLGIMVVRTLSRTLFFNPGRTIQFRLRNTLFARALDLPRATVRAMGTGDLISRSTNDTNGVRGLVGFGSLMVFNVALSLVLTVGKMLSVHAWLTLLCLVPLALAAVVLWYAVKAMFRLTAELQGHLGVLGERIIEAYAGVATLQAYSALHGAVRRFDEANGRLVRITLALVRIRSWLMPIVSVVGSGCVVLLLYVGGPMVGRSITLGELASFAVYIQILVSALTGVGWVVNAVQRGWVSLGRVFEVLDASGGRRAPSLALPDPPRRGLALAVAGLTHAHDDAPDVPVLRDLSFEVAAGETVGIFGVTGSGKSTLLDVLARLAEPAAGTVRVEGVDVTDVPLDDWWSAVAYVPQEARLFSESIRANVTLGVPRADEERIVRAAADAGLAPDLEVLPAGLDTPIGERGVTLSGGQRQRVALARAFCRDYRVLLLDDVLSAVDHATERRLVDAVYRRGADATTIVVSHRTSVLRRADRILVLDEGRLVAAGSHDELLAQPGNPYQRTWLLQQAEAALERRAERRIEPTRAPVASGGLAATELARGK